MNSIYPPDVSSWQGASALPYLACVRAQGADAASFLHGQLSQDVTGLETGQARHAAYCSAKGRMLATMLLFKAGPDEIVMVMGADVLPATLKRLSMFVMRAKVKLTLEPVSLSLLGLVGHDAAPAGQVLSLPASPYEVLAAPGSEAGPAWLIRLPDVLGVTRALWVGPQAAGPALAASACALESASASALPATAWPWLEVMSGIARVELATADQFVPQMVNFELVGGINFKKGCYPGQEVVARSQSRGTLKRRLFLAHAGAPLLAGQEVFSANDPGQPAGLVVNAAAMPGDESRWSALIELKLQFDASVLTASSVEGAALSLDRLPYAVEALDL